MSLLKTDGKTLNLWYVHTWGDIIMIRSLDSQNKGNLVTLLVILTKYLLEQLKGDACFHIVKGEAVHQRRQRVKTGARGATSGRRTRLRCGWAHLFHSQGERLTGSGPGSNSQDLSPLSRFLLPAVHSTFSKFHSFQNSATSWGPRAQTHEPVENISQSSSHSIVQSILWCSL